MVVLLKRKCEKVWEDATTFLIVQFQALGMTACKLITLRGGNETSSQDEQELKTTADSLKIAVTRDAR